MSTARLRSSGPRARITGQDHPQARTETTAQGPAPHAGHRNGRTGPAPEAPPPLQAALDYRARRLCIALDDAQTRDAALAHFPPATAALLRWWCAGPVCRARVDNFNRAQLRAILHVLLAHDLLGGDDPAQLYRRACEAGTGATRPSRAHYRLRLAPGSGLRWVLQALLVWCWSAAEDRTWLRLSAAGPALQRHLRRAILGEGEGPGSASSSLLRHDRLFLPPALRGPFRAWLAAAGETLLETGDPAPRDSDAPATGQALPGPYRLTALSADGRHRLRIDLLIADDTDALGTDEALLDLPLARAIRLGACKWPVLEAVAPVGARLRADPPVRGGGRPRLSRRQQRLLCDALAMRDTRERAFTALDPARRPRLTVLCADAQLLRAARRWLIAAGLDPIAGIAVRPDGPVAAQVRVVLDDRPLERVRRDGLPPLDAAPSRFPIADPQVCVIAVLRTHRGDPADAADRALRVVAAGAAALWPEPEFAELRAENAERAARGLPPRHRIDVLSVFDDPDCRDDYAGLPHALGDGTPVADTDDLFLAPARTDTGNALRLPGYGAFEAPAGEDLGALPQRILRRRRALAVARSPHGHAPCDPQDGGLRRAFLECAEADPAIECHALPDPRRHAAPGRETLLARCADARGWPDALVRTARHLYLVEFLPCEPLRGAPPGAAECALHAWLRVANARAALEPGARTWRRVALPAPVFWSWKRRGAALSVLLDSLPPLA